MLNSISLHWVEPLFKAIVFKFQVLISLHLVWCFLFECNRPLLLLLRLIGLVALSLLRLTKCVTTLMQVQVALLNLDLLDLVEDICFIDHPHMPILFF